MLRAFLDSCHPELWSDGHTQRYYADMVCNPIVTIGNINYGSDGLTYR
jgi:hypothetical protein